MSVPDTARQRAETPLEEARKLIESKKGTYGHDMSRAGRDAYLLAVACAVALDRVDALEAANSRGRAAEQDHMAEIVELRRRVDTLEAENVRLKTDLHYATRTLSQMADKA